MADKTSKLRYNIMNILANIDLKTNLDMEKVSECLGNIELHSGDFEGGIYHLDELNTIVIILSEGKIVCTNARTIKDVEDTFERIVEELKKCNLLQKKKVCPSCGAVIDEEDLVCLECGYVFPTNE